VGAYLAGLLTGLSLIVAIGAQNAYVLRVGLSRQHVGLAVTICALADVVLIILGVGGVGSIVASSPGVLEVVRIVGVAFLVGFALLSFRRATRTEVLLPSEEAPRSARVVAIATLSFTFLNPHVYLDTVLLLGSIGGQYGHARWLFAAGACTGSILWFSTLGFGARAAARIMARPVTWRILDGAVGVVMLLVAANVATLHLGH
jgi:L-lysine exporter family protein LysE/ArgO